MALKLEIREHQIKNANNDNVIINCNASVATYSLGNVLDNNWHDISNDIGNLNQLELEWSRKTENIGQEKGTSFQIQIIGASYTKIFSTLFDTPCGVLNSFDVRITDLLCGVVFNLFEIKADNIEYCEGDGCILTLRLREQNMQQLCFSRTYIYDDWQKWFNADGTSTKQHPYFLICVDYGKKAFQLGIDLFSLRNYQIARKRLGMDNYGAAPYIKDIILNATMKCGLELETIFDAGKEAEFDCLLWNYNGVYQKNNLTYHSPTNLFDYNTRGGNLILMPEFLDWLCELYNAEWFIRNGKLTIRYATDVLNQNSFLDLSTIENDLIQSICYSYDLTKKNHTKAYEYQIDPSDKASQQINYLYNDIVNFDTDNNNQMLDGESTKQFKFASTGFVRDETRDDYIKEDIDSAYDFSQIFGLIIPIIAIGMAISGITGTLGVLAMLGAYGVWLGFRQQKYYQWQRKLIYDETFKFTGCIRLEGDGSMATPRIIRKTPQSDIFEPRVIEANVNTIQPYPYYNKGLKPYNIINDVFNVWNYPLYFDSKFKGNLFDLHHEVLDNPLFINFGNKKITVKLALCCEFLKKLGLPIDDSIKLLETIDVNSNNSMVLDEIKLSYKTMLIELVGRQIIKNNVPIQNYFYYFSFTITGNDRLNLNGGNSRASFFVDASIVEVDWDNNGNYVNSVQGSNNYSSPNYPDNLPRTINVRCTSFNTLSFLNGNYNVDSVNLSTLPNLKNLYIAKNEFTVVPNLSGNPILEYILSYDSYFTSMPVFVSNSLKKLDLQGSSHFPINTPFNAADFAGLPNLEDLNLSYSNIGGVVDITGMNNLKYINLFQNKVTDLASIVNLKYINLRNNNLTNINSVLNKLVTAWTANGNNAVFHGQTPAAPPTGQGIIDKNTLIGLGNIITTD